MYEPTWQEYAESVHNYPASRALRTLHEVYEEDTLTNEERQVTIAAAQVWATLATMHSTYELIDVLTGKLTTTNVRLEELREGIPTDVALVRDLVGEA